MTTLSRLLGDPVAGRSHVVSPQWSLDRWRLTTLLQTLCCPSPPASPSCPRLPPLQRTTAAKGRLLVRDRRTCSPVWAVLSPLSRSRPRSTSLKTPSRLGRQAPGRGELDVRYSTRRSRPSPGCAQARQALPLVRGAQTGRAGPCPPRGGAYCGPKAVPTTVRDRPARSKLI